LLRRFESVTIYDKASGVAAALADSGANVVSSPRAVAEASDMVLLALPSPSAVRDVLTSEDGLLSAVRAGTVIIDVSTIDPYTSREMYALAQERGAEYLDAPMSGGAPRGGGTEGARQASITFLVGGSEDAFQRARAVLETLGRRCLYLGPSGSGSTVKLISNYIAGVHNLAAAEALTLGAAAGFSPETLFSALSETDASSYFLSDYVAPRVSAKNYEAGFAVDLMLKDHRLVGALSDRLDVPMLLNDVATHIYEAVRASGRGQDDLVSAVGFMNALANVDIYKPGMQHQLA
jgi:3-hydroxyisobutyrate dehydrogenase-like beta-hydroxyacid dehydrogenase